MYSLLIKNALIADGSGDEPYEGCIAFSGDRIAKVSRDIHAGSAREVLDAEGMTLSPGFIDPHGHSDISILASTAAEGKSSQGITTEIAGNCGLSVFPLSNKNNKHIKNLFSSYNVNIDWKDIDAYSSRINNARPGLNLASHCGHNTLRAAVCGYDNISISQKDIARMAALLHQSLKAGACGFSTGLIYVPGKFSSTSEIESLAEIAAKTGTPWTTHLRSEGNRITEAVGELIRTARKAKCRTIHISHLKTAGQHNWHKLDEVLGLIEETHARGDMEITADRYPYTESMTQLSAFMPEPYSEMDDITIENHLKNPANFAKLVECLNITRHDTYWTGKKIVSTDNTLLKKLTGLDIEKLADTNIPELAKTASTSPAELCALLLKDAARSSMASSSGMSRENMLRILALPFVCCCTDESARPKDYSIGRSHPRGFGAFPEFIRLMQPMLGTGETIRKMTSLPAQIFGITSRGSLAEGFFADAVLFDPEKIRHPVKTANFANPHLTAEGILKVWVNGKISYDSTTGSTFPGNGRFLKIGIYS
ncbi:MAG: amidohydrolase family protein [Victivallales bacterium]|nr:amidohydrolase family protein [Victivallales bacterium]